MHIRKFVKIDKRRLAGVDTSSLAALDMIEMETMTDNHMIAMVFPVAFLAG